LPSRLAHTDVMIKGLPGFRAGKRQLLKEGILKSIHNFLRLRALFRLSSYEKEVHTVIIIYIIHY